MKKLLMLLMVVFLVSACSSEKKIIMPTNYTRIALRQGVQEELIYLGDKIWEIDKMYVDNESLQYFVRMIQEIALVDVIESESEYLETFTLVFTDVDESKEYTFYRSQDLEDPDALIEVDGVRYRVENEYLANFSIEQLFAHTIFFEEEANLVSVSFNDFELNMKNLMNEYESKTAISGMFLNDVYNQNYAVKYQESGTIKESSYLLRGIITDSVHDFSKAESLSFQYDNGTTRDIRYIQSDENINELIIELDGSTFRVPRSSLIYLNKSNISLLDTFAFIAPLSDLNKITITTSKGKSLVLGEDDSMSEDDVVDIFQHLLLIKGEAEYQGEELLEEELTVTYEMDSVVTKITLYKLNDDSYAIMRDGEIDWTMGADNFDLLLKRISRLVH